jgi:ABC-type sugar transport system permease subunit
MEDQMSPFKFRKKKNPQAKLGKLERKQELAGYSFIAIWFVGMLVFTLIPMCQSFYYMWFKIKARNGLQFTYVGTSNLTQIWIEDPDFIQGIVGYVWQTLLQVPIIVVFALIIAIMLNGKIKCRGLFRLIFFLPVIIVSGPVMNMLVSEGAASIPALNTQAVVSAFDMFLPTAIAQQLGTLFGNMIMTLWYSGVQILIFLSALQKIDPGLYEAAKMDGGSGWECFWKITLPTIKPMILINAVYTVIFLSSNEQNQLINLIKTAMFSATAERGYGYASAMAWIYSLLVTVIVLIFFGLLGSKKDVYDRMVKKRKKLEKKEARNAKRVERRSVRNAKKIEKARSRGKFRTYDGQGDY